MKRLAIVLFLTLTLAALPVGCSNLPRVTFTQTAKATKTVDQALRDWNEFIKANPKRVTLAQNNQVRDAFNKWKQLNLNVIDLGSQLSSTNTPAASKADLEAALHSQVSDAAQATTDLVNLVNKLTK